MTKRDNQRLINSYLTARKHGGKRFKNFPEGFKKKALKLMKLNKITRRGVNMTESEFKICKTKKGKKGYKRRGNNPQTNRRYRNCIRGPVWTKRGWKASEKLRNQYAAMLKGKD